MNVLIEVPATNLQIQHQPLMPALLSAIESVLSSGMFILGSEVQRFESRIAERCGTRFAVGVADGTDALILIMKGLGIGKGDEVITPPNSFLASTSSIVLAGARPVFVDVGTDMNLDPQRIEAAITEHTKAIMPVHLTGRPAKMDEIQVVADKHGLLVIEDCAQAIGATYRGKPVGSFGIAGAFSLHPLKNLNACGDGGVITTDDEDLYNFLLLARNHGLRNRDACEFWSVNSRLDALQAAILNVKLDYLDEWTERRRAIASQYTNALSSYVETPVETDHERAVFHTYVIQTDRRDELKDYLDEKGIQARVHYPTPIHLLDAARDLGYGRGDLPNTERQADRILTIPLYPELSEAQVNHVIESIRSFFQ
jgi:dTDP-4-amino-4,6-dideoxygalactose transaminase